jgi:SAM-dependent methyltransferase
MSRPGLIPAQSYQAIKLPAGAAVEGADRSYLHPAIFGGDFAGKSLLDIGTYHGHFCIEAMRRGAARAVGLDVDTDSILAARAIAQHAGVRPDYIEADFADWPAEERFDVVLGLNVLHHLFDPIHALHKMTRLARERLVLEVAGPRPRDVEAGRIGNAILAAGQEPMIALGHPRKGKIAHAAQYAFMFTPAAVRMILEKHFVCFEPLTITPSPHKERFVVCADKRRIDTLTIVAGPTSTGKSTLLERLQESPDLRRAAGIVETIDTVTSASKLDLLPRGVLGNVLFHYDTMRPHTFGLRTYARDPALTLALSARDVDVITIDTSVDRLLSQISAANPGSARHEKLKQRYGEPDFLIRWNDAWRRFVSALPNRRRSITAINRGSYEFHS